MKNEVVLETHSTFLWVLITMEVAAIIMVLIGVKIGDDNGLISYLGLFVIFILAILILFLVASL